LIPKTSYKRIEQHVSNLASPDVLTSERAERALLRYYAKASVPHLISACGSDNPVVRFRAVWILGKSQAPEAYESILSLCSDPDPRVSYDAVLALGHLGDLRALNELKAFSLDDSPHRPAFAALGLLGRFDFEDD